MENTVDPEEWRQEVERVLPSLKVHHRSDNRDWRLHYEQMHNYHDNIKTVLSDTKVHLHMFFIIAISTIYTSLI